MLADKITLLNEIVLECLNETDELKIIQAFTEIGIKVLGADFGFVWLNSAASKKLELAYTSPGLPFTPRIPRKGGRNYSALKSSSPNFVSQIKKTPSVHYLTKYVKSFVIIPLVYKQTVYGTMALCFKEEEYFSTEKRVLSIFIGNSVAQAVNINRLIVSEHTARVLSEKQKAHFRALIENSHEIIALINKTGKILYVSQSVEKILGIKADEAVGKHISTFIYNNKPKKTSHYIQKVIQNPYTYHVTEFSYKNREGEVSFLECTSTNMIYDQNVGGIVINIRDVSETKRLEVIKESKRLLEEEKLKIESIADATHELRTPLAIIKGNVDLALLKGKNKKPAQAAFKAINKEIKHLSEILSDMTLFTSNKPNFENKIAKTKVNIETLVTEVVERCTALAHKKNISIITSVIPKLTIEGDKDYLEKMLMNLVRNSIVYGNKNGHTHITVSHTPDIVTITVADNGIGISEVDLPRVFDRFYRADKSRSSGGKNIGLGLAIVKWVAEAHGGRVSVKAVEHEGTTFTVSLPTTHTQ